MRKQLVVVMGSPSVPCQKCRNATLEKCADATPPANQSPPPRLLTAVPKIVSTTAPIMVAKKHHAAASLSPHHTRMQCESTKVVEGVSAGKAIRGDTSFRSGARHSRTSTCHPHTYILSSSPPLLLECAHMICMRACSKIHRSSLERAHGRCANPCVPRRVPRCRHRQCKT